MDSIIDKIIYFCGVMRLLKISVVLCVSALYCLSIGLYNGNINNSYAGSKSNQTEISSSVVSSKLFCHTEQTESLAIVYCNSSRTSLKNSFNQFSACPIAAGKLPFKNYLPYIYFSENLHIGFKPTDIIFPFHYFW